MDKIVPTKIVKVNESMKILFKEIIPSLEIKLISGRLNCIFLLIYLKIPKKLIEAKRRRM